jgi:hypothetical protein
LKQRNLSPIPSKAASATPGVCRLRSLDFYYKFAIRPNGNIGDWFRTGNGRDVSHHHIRAPFVVSGNDKSRPAPGGSQVGKREVGQDDGAEGNGQARKRSTKSASL